MKSGRHSAVVQHNLENLNSHPYRIMIEKTQYKFKRGSRGLGYLV